MIKRLKSKGSKTETEGIAPPIRSKGILSDIRYFILHKPDTPTLIRFNSEEERENYSQRIMQRLGISVFNYTVLNIHKIGLAVPVRYVFEELLHWSGDSTCWPNHIATVDRINGHLEHIQIFLFGRKKYPLGFKKGIFGLKYIPLFNLDAIKFQHLPDPSDFDNARYLLYKCSGGYPIGIFSMYARSSVADQEEKEQTQLFLVVGFNFYGKEHKHGPETLINKIWEKIHNRVTANIMNRLKQLCEWRFQKVRETFQNH
jgi:hypothetical protein